MDSVKPKKLKWFFLTTDVTVVIGKYFEENSDYVNVMKVFGEVSRIS